MATPISTPVTRLTPRLRQQRLSSQPDPLQCALHELRTAVFGDGRAQPRWTDPPIRSPGNHSSRAFRAPCRVSHSRLASGRRISRTTPSPRDGHGTPRSPVQLERGQHAVYLAPVELGGLSCSSCHQYWGRYLPRFHYEEGTFLCQSHHKRLASVRCRETFAPIPPAVRDTLD